MRQHSKHLNPFQPYPERERDDDCDNENEGAAVENNLSRALFSALANAGDAAALSGFLHAIAAYGTPALSERVRGLAAAMRDVEPALVEWGLQTWPAAPMRERDRLDVVLIGISSAHKREWTHDQRYAPDRCCPDAWIYIPRTALLVFECKNDEHPLDATQISAYAHKLKLFSDDGVVPRAKPHSKLACLEEAKSVQNACDNLVLDVPWSAVVTALAALRQVDDVSVVGRWLCGQAADYLRSHVFPVYQGMATILEWLKGPDDSARRRHLRRLVKALGKSLSHGVGQPGAITFAGDETDGPELKHGSGSAVFVRLERGGQPLRISWLDKKVDAVMWFRFADDNPAVRTVGLEFYLQASGSNPGGTGSRNWNRASARHWKCAEAFEKTVEKWAHCAPASTRVIVETVKFNGKKRNWQGGGVFDQEHSDPLSPPDALEFLRTHRAELWGFPRAGADLTVEQAAEQVRKPALSLQAPLDATSLGECRDDCDAMQKVLQRAIDLVGAVT